jgi:recombinational DNA repair ATPase RecF
MAQTRLHYSAHKEFPILLLDDVLSELDREKQMRFVNYLLSTEAQIFLTTTDATSIPEMAHRSVYEVIEGVFKESDRFFTGGLSV